MRTAQQIINDARFELAKHIITLMRKLDAYFTTGKKNLMTAPEEDVVIDFVECEEVPNIRVRVDYMFLDIEDEITEVRPLDFIATSDDHNFYVGVGGCDFYADDLTTDDLLVIAKVLEDTYEKSEEE